MAHDYYCTACECPQNEGDGSYANPQDAESWTCQCGAHAGPEGAWMQFDEAVAQGLYVEDEPAVDKRGRPFPKAVNEGAFPPAESAPCTGCGGAVFDSQCIACGAWRTKAARNVSGGVDVVIEVRNAAEIGRGSDAIGEALRKHFAAGGGIPGVRGPHKVEEVYLNDVRIYPEARPAGTAEMDDEAKRKAEAERIAKAMGW